MPLWSQQCARYDSEPANRLGKFSIHRGKERHRKLQIQINYTSLFILQGLPPEGKLKVLMLSITNRYSWAEARVDCVVYGDGR